ncbi:Pectinesterase isoform 2 [Hibiscus syriacus]|uniref:Pectinesterase n=1 Tax=Hibiscus syriacus TaxID=106335 RepID=A0A6A2Y1W7_HIBSY|nr:Pectinesterase isoform 2 [Hibiscus syriacus]
MTGTKGIENGGVYAAICMIVFFAPIVQSQSTQIPEDKSKVNDWFSSVIKPLSQRAGTLDPELVQAEAEPKIIKVKQGDGGDFATIMKAIDSVPAGNSKRVIISIGPGSYQEKITIPRDKPYVTLVGDPKNMPNLTFDATAKDYGTVDSGTLTTLSNYFVGAYLNIINSAPKPDGKREGAQAVALRVSGDRSAFYGCNIFGFQDTVCDDRGNHFFKDCYIRGTVDFIFGSGKSLYLRKFIGGHRVLHCARKNHRNGKGFILGRAWKSSPRVVYAYTEMTDVVNPAGWSHDMQPERAKTVYYGEYKCTGVGASSSGREPFTKQLTEKEAEPFLSLDYVIEKDLVRVRGRKSKTPLHYVSKVANQDFFLDRFLEACPDSILDVTTQNSTALHIAVENRRLDVLQMLKLLLNCKADKHATDQAGLTALGVSQQHGYTESITGLRGCFIQVVSKFIPKLEEQTASYVTKASSLIFRDMDNISGENRNALLVILGLMLLTATYQATLSPPGGVWQGGNASKKLGISVMDPSQFLLFYIPTYVVFIVTFFLTLSLLKPFPYGFRTALQVLLAFLAVCFHQSISFIVPTSSASIILSPLGDRFHLNGVHVYRISSVEIQCFDSGMLDFTISLLRINRIVVSLSSMSILHKAEH